MGLIMLRTLTMRARVKGSRIIVFVLMFIALLQPKKMPAGECWHFLLMIYISVLGKYQDVICADAGVSHITIDLYWCPQYQIACRNLD